MLIIQITSLNETKAQKIENSQEKSKLHCRVFISNATLSLFTNACYDLIFSLPSSTMITHKLFLYEIGYIRTMFPCRNFVTSM